MSYEQIDHQAASFIALLWRDLYNRIRELMHPHRHEHEPGGKDQVHLPLGFLSDVTLTSPSDGEVLTYDLATTAWINGAGGGGGGEHQAYVGTGLPTSVVPPGPVNITSTNFTITAVSISFDGTVTGKFDAGSYTNTFSSAVSDSGLTDTWNVGDSMTLRVDTYDETASYVKVDIALRG